MIQEFQDAIVVDIIQETPNTKRFFLQIKDATNFEFESGQFITLDLPIHEKKNKRWRSYSIASHANGTNCIELVIVWLEGGAGTTYLFNEVNIGSILSMRGPIGHFVLPKEIPSDLFLISTGTGIAPFRSMIHYLIDKKMMDTNIYLVCGYRTQSDLLYHHEMETLSKEYENIKYLPTLSREQWSGHSGYVHDVYKAYCTNKPNAEFMLCGWRNMIDQAKDELLQLGYDKKQIHFELYG
jgi:ferredoxin-NADP reductase